MKISDKQLEAICKSKDSQVRKLLLLLEQPINCFEPRSDNHVQYDEQHSYVTDSWNGIKVAIAGNASGKTICSAYAVARFLRDTPAPRDLCPYIVASQTFDLVGAIWVEKLSQFITSDLIENVRWRNTNRQFPQEVIMAPSSNGNRWVIEFRSYEQGRQQFQATSIGGFWCDEQIDYDVLTEIYMRCRDYDFVNSKFYSLTPLMSDWKLEELYKNRHEEEVYRTFKFYRMNTMLNFALSDTWKRNFFDVVPEDMQETRQIGAFARFEGLIYKEFRDEVHLKKPMPIPIDALHYRSIDFGFRNAACIWAYLYKGTWFIYDELLCHDELTEDFCGQIIKKSEGWGWSKVNPLYRSTYADWADPQAMVRLRNLGVACTPARKDVGVGIDAVRAALIGPGKIPTLYVWDTCKELIREIKEYIWHTGPKNPRNAVDDSDKPVKAMDHLCDALRYLVFTKLHAVDKPWEGVKQPENRRNLFGMH